MRYAIDTDVAIDYLKGRSEIVSRLEGLPEIYITSATVAELFYGAYNLDFPAEKAAKLAHFLESFHLLDTTYYSCRLFGAMKARQMQKGKARGDFDLLIASVCIANGCTLITRNLKHYSDLKGLSVESI